ncbi:hypothetical protein TYRP_023210 [Tyrophagus putrescentiae]|nr:hypothetical protein TYRP_023210 [Tyrophagus putrescentiae]
MEAKHAANRLKLFESGDNSDFTVIVENRRIPVHKAFLSQRSSVFRALLSNANFVENAKNEIEINDTSFETMQVFLTTLYTGKKPDADKLSLDLLSIADKYDVFELKMACQEQLSISLDNNNVLDRLLEAIKHCAEFLTLNCKFFLLDNLSEVMKTPRWKMFHANEDVLTIDVFNFIKNSSLFTEYHQISLQQLNNMRNGADENLISDGSSSSADSDVDMREISEDEDEDEDE